MTECVRCGDCCRDLPVTGVHEKANVWAKRQLADPRVREGDWSGYYGGSWVQQLTWLAQLEPISGPHRLADGSIYFRYRCPRLDEETNLCTAYADRPYACRGYPWYGKEPSPTETLSPRCSFNADVRTMLPIVEVRHG